MENIMQEDNFSLPPVQSEEDSLKDMECQTNMSCADIDILQVIYQSMQQEIKALKKENVTVLIIAHKHSLTLMKRLFNIQV